MIIKPITVSLRKNGKSYAPMVHRLVLKIFVGPCPPGKEAAHLDGNPANASLKNLQWVTPQENQEHKKLHGTWVCGSKNYNAKLHEEQVVEIIAKLAEGQRCVDLGKKYEVREAAILKIKQGKTWKHLERP